MTRDEGWQFLVLGRSIERADMTARLVATASLTSGAAWATTLRACGAYEAFLRTYRASRPSAAPPSSCCSTGCSRGRWSTA